MKKNTFFKRRKKATEKKPEQKATVANLDFYGTESDDVQEYHNPYLAVTEFFDLKKTGSNVLN